MNGYDVASVVGWLLIPIAIYLIAILLSRASKIAGWILFAVGVGMSALALLGASHTLSTAGGSAQIIFFARLFSIIVLTAAAAVAIGRRPRS